ncbi:PAS domain-containing protein, partial [Arthrospira platensis SPKY1]|nr:PAS domain-containing protein [Arthrospira platensis SPKY1]
MILRVNQGFTRITGYSTHEAVGQTPAMLASGRHDSRFFNAMWLSLQADDRWEGEIWNRHRDGTIFPCRLTIQAVRDEQGEVRNFVGALFDISRQKSAEAELAFLDR